MKYFTECKNLDELKKEFRRLAMLHHPDRGGDAEIMKLINAEYDAVFPALKLAYNRTAAEPTHETAESTRDEFYTRNGWKGDKYQLGRSTKEIAAEIRAYVKKAYPDCKFSVSFKGYSGGSSIYVRLMSGPYAALKTATHHDVNYYYIERDTELTDWARAVMIDVNDCICSYRFSDCDSMTDYFDVNFWYSIGVGRWDKHYEINAKVKKLAGEVKETKNESKPDGVRVQINDEFNGIEVYFDGKPDAETRTALKADGWRWHSKKACWYNKNTEGHLQQLRQIIEGPKMINGAV